MQTSKRPEHPRATGRALVFLAAVFPATLMGALLPSAAQAQCREGAWVSTSSAALAGLQHQLSGCYQEQFEQVLSGHRFRNVGSRRLEFSYSLWIRDRMPSTSAKCPVAADVGYQHPALLAWGRKQVRGGQRSTTIEFTTPGRTRPATRVCYSQMRVDGVSLDDRGRPVQTSPPPGVGGGRTTPSMPRTTPPTGNVPPTATTPENNNPYPPGEEETQSYLPPDFGSTDIEVYALGITALGMILYVLFAGGGG